MKRALSFFTAVLILSGAKAQEESSINVDSMLVNIDMTSLTSEILYERVFPWARLDTVNQLGDYSINGDYFEQALYELYLASNKQKFMTYSNLRKFFVSDSLQNIVDLGIINASFHTLNYNPENEEEGALRIIDSLFQKIENGEPVFLPQHVFIVSPLKHFLRANENQNIIYRFSDSLLLQDALDGKSLDRLIANFGTAPDYVIVENGVLSNQEIEIAYSNDGEKTLSFSATFSDGSTLSISGTVFIKTIFDPGPGGLIDNGLIKATIPFTGYEPNDIPLFGRIDYRIYYREGATEKKLMKPIVIIDGFDPGDKRKIEDSDPHPKQTDLEHRSILEIMSYTDSQDNPVSILKKLRELGYDVVIVNHPRYAQNYVELNSPIIDGGADYIERNAMAHIELYQALNTLLTANNSTEELVIVGPSMGGQISRYALAYMEEQLALTGDPQWDHNTRLWVSVDSPHLGANVPMGVQTLMNILYYFSNSAKAGHFVKDVLGSAAARQQMIEQAGVDANAYLPINPAYLDARTVSQGFLQDQGHPFFIQYYNTLYSNGLNNSRGYPQNLRRIAMVNGSLTSSDEYGNPFVPGGTALNGNIITPDHYAYSSSKVFKMAGYVNSDLGDFHGVTMEYYFMPSTGASHKIAYYKQRELFSLGGWDYYDLYIANNNSRGNLDNAPAGWYHTQQEVAYAIEPTTPKQIDYWTIYNLEHVSSFIPTVSSLGFINPDFNWHAAFDRNLACATNPEIPFHNYYGPKINERHTSFTQESFEWFKQELDGDNNYPEPTVYLDNTNISGPDFVCHTNPATYYIAACTVSVDSWTVSPNLIIVSSDNNSITILPKNSLSNGEGFVMAHFAHDSAKKTFWVGTNVNGSMTSNSGTYTPYSYSTFSMPAAVQGATYNWSISLLNSNTCTTGSAVFIEPADSTPTTFVSQGGGASVSWWGCTGNYEIVCEIINDCGVALRDSMVVTVSDPSDPCDDFPIDTTPNPTNGPVQIDVPSFTPAGDPCDYGEYPYGNPINNIVKVYDISGNLRYSNNFETTTFTINLDVEPGNYILNIIASNGRKGQEIIIVE